MSSKVARKKDMEEEIPPSYNSVMQSETKHPSPSAPLLEMEPSSAQCKFTPTSHLVPSVPTVTPIGLPSCSYSTSAQPSTICISSSPECPELTEDDESFADYVTFYPTKRDVEEETTGCLGEFNWVVCGYAFFLFVIYSIIPAAMVTLGAVHLNNCKMDFQIPIFAMVSGGFFCTLTLITSCVLCFGDYEYRGRKIGKPMLWVVAVGFFFFFFIIQLWGSVVVFRQFSSWDTWERPDACDRGTYEFLFAMLIIYWVLLPVVPYILLTNDDDDGDWTFS